MNDLLKNNRAVFVMLTQEASSGEAGKHLIPEDASFVSMTKNTVAEYAQLLVLEYINP